MGYPEYSHPGERWAPVLGYEGRYVVSTRGRVWGLKRDGQLAEALDRKGYPRVSLYDERGQKTKKVHHLVLDAFVGPRPPGHECAHLDGNPCNPWLDNLAWVTPTDNHAHKRRHGTNRDGFDNAGALLSPDEVREIRRRRGDGEQWKDISMSLGKGISVVIDAGLGRTYPNFEPHTIQPPRPGKPRLRVASQARGMTDAPC